MTRPLVKRNDYSIAEIEKKYSNQELNQLILFDSVFKYPPKKYFPNKLCYRCQNKPITKEFQLSENKECLDCYAIGKKENYDYIKKCISEQKYEFDGNCVLENKLYLGGIISSFVKDEMKKIGITHILMVGYFMTPLYPEDFKYENIEVNDNKNENIIRYLVKGIKFIDESNVCYTHCQLGKSRSAAVVMAYVMYKKRIHFSEAFDFVKEKRNVAFPNEGFQWQLEDFDIILNNFNYNLNKCDEFIKNFFENKEALIKSEKSYLLKRKNENQSDDSDSDNFDVENIFEDEDEEENNSKKEEIKNKKENIEDKKYKNKTNNEKDEKEQKEENNE